VDVFTPDPAKVDVITPDPAIVDVFTPDPAVVDVIIPDPDVITPDPAVVDFITLDPPPIALDPPLEYAVFKEVEVEDLSELLEEEPYSSFQYRDALVTTASRFGLKSNLSIRGI